MKKLMLMTAVVLVLALALTGCVKVDRYQEDGLVDTRTYDLEGFTRVKVGHAFHLTVTPADDYSVTITAGENVLEKLDVYVSGDTLVIELDGWWWDFSASPEAVVTMPVLTGLELSGASDGTAEGFSTDATFRLVVSGASELDMDLVTGDMDMDISGASRVRGSLEAEDVDINISGASQLDLEGRGEDLDIEVSGASQVDLSDFPVNDTDVEVSGASGTKINTSGTLDLEVSGASRLVYTGDPDIRDTSITGGSSVHEVND